MSTSYIEFVPKLYDKITIYFIITFAHYSNVFLGNFQSWEFKNSPSSKQRTGQCQKLQIQSGIYKIILIWCRIL